MLRTDTSLINGNHFPRLDLPHEGRPHNVQRAGFGGNHPPLVQSAQAQRPHPLRVAGGKQGVAVRDGETERALDARQQIPHGRQQPMAVPDLVGKQGGHHVGVGGMILLMHQLFLVGLIQEL